MLNHFTPPTRIDSRKPFWPIRLGTGIGFLALFLVISGSNVFSHGLSLEKSTMVEDSDELGPLSPRTDPFVSESGCRGDFVPEEALPPNTTYTVEPADTQPIVLPAKETLSRTAPANQ